MAQAWPSTRLGSPIVPLALLPTSRLRGMDLSLIQIQAAKLAAGVQHGGPNFVRALMLRRTERDRCAETQIEVADRLQRFDQSVSVQFGPSFFQPGAQQLGGDVAFQRDEAGAFLGKELGQALAIAQNAGSARAVEGHNLRDD